MLPLPLQTMHFSMAFTGFLGVFEGHFSKLPYYYKVREYADFESRDLWTYELNLTQDQVDEMVEHLWDLGHTYFDYYFLGENCSYHLMSLLDVVLPDSTLLKALSFYVHPLRDHQSAHERTWSG